MISEVHGSLHKIKKCLLGLHRWEFVYTRGAYEYYRCRRCNWRKAIKVYGVYSPVDHTWLDRIGE